MLKEKERERERLTLSHVLGIGLFHLIKCSRFFPQIFPEAVFNFLLKCSERACGCVWNSQFEFSHLCDSSFHQSNRNAMCVFSHRWSPGGRTRLIFSLRWWRTWPVRTSRWVLNRREISKQEVTHELTGSQLFRVLINWILILILDGSVVLFVLSQENPITHLISRAVDTHDIVCWICVLSEIMCVFSGEEAGVCVSCALRWGTAGSCSVVHLYLPKRLKGP